MIFEVKRGYINLWNAAPWLVANVTGLYNSYAPPNTSYPYVTMHVIDVVPSYTMRPSKPLHVLRSQFDIWSSASSEEEVSGIHDHLTSCFDDAVLSVPDYNIIRHDRQPLIPWSRNEQEKFWRYTQDYLVWLQLE